MAEPEEPEHPRIAIVGRPNVGKSTLVNRLLGEERVIAFDQPGTTRDAIDVILEMAGRTYTLIDTAGLRKRGKVWEAVEKFSVVKTLQAIERANVVVLVVDARQGVSEQDAHISGFILESGRALVVAVNKWDGLPESRARFGEDRPGAQALAPRIRRVPPHLGVEGHRAQAAFPGRGPRLRRGVRQAVDAEAHARPDGRHRPAPAAARAARSGRSCATPTRAAATRRIVVIHGTSVNRIGKDYRRYLENTFCRVFKLKGTPLRIELKQGENPYAEKKRNLLTPRQEAKRRRDKIHGRKTYGGKDKK